MGKKLPIQYIELVHVTIEMKKMTSFVFNPFVCRILWSYILEELGYLHLPKLKMKISTTRMRNSTTYTLVSLLSTR